MKIAAPGDRRAGLRPLVKKDIVTGAAPRNPERMSKSTFIARTHELSTLVDRCLNTGESTAIVSEFPNGKTTILDELQRRLKGSNCRVAYIDVQILDRGTTPEQLWAEVFTKFGGARRGRSGFRELQRLVDPPAGAAVPTPHVLLIRDFLGLLHMPEFRNGDPWGKLRGLAQSHNFSLVVTSRVDLDALTKEVQEWMQGSPFFNAFREMVLEPLTPEEAQCYLAFHRPRLPQSEIEWVLCCAGGHPKMLNLLGEALEQALAIGLSRSGARREALARCRRETRVVLHNAWLFFPWQERWMLLCTALGQWTGSGLSPPSCVLSPVHKPKPTPNSLIRVMEGQLSRDELRRALLAVLPDHTSALPGACASDLEYFTSAAGLLVRHEAASEFLAYLQNSRPSAADEAPWWLTIGSCERLSLRGILAPTESQPGWRVIPPLFYWWLLDQLHEMVILPQHKWLVTHKLEQHITTHDVQTLRAQVLRHKSLVRDGATHLVEMECL